MTRPPAGAPFGGPADNPAREPSPALPPGGVSPASTTPDPPTRVPGKPARAAGTGTQGKSGAETQRKSGTEAPGKSGAGTQGKPGPANGAPGQDDVLLTARQSRRAEREARRQAKDEAYELRMKRKKAKDGTTWRGHHIVDTRGLAEAFPEPETPELPTSTVRRRITHAVVLVALLSMVVAGVVLAGMVQRGELELSLGPGKPTPTPFSCPADTLEYPANKAVTVNVYNGGSSEGMAGKVGAELKKRGYQVKEIDNRGTELEAPTVIISGPAGHAAAFNLQRNFPNSEYVEDKREDASVDVVLTSGYTGLVAAKAVDQKAGVLSCPRLSPPPSDPAQTAGAGAGSAAPAKP